MLRVGVLLPSNRVMQGLTKIDFAARYTFAADIDFAPYARTAHMAPDGNVCCIGDIGKGPWVTCTIGSVARD